MSNRAATPAEIDEFVGLAARKLGSTFTVYAQPAGYHRSMTIEVVGDPVFLSVKPKPNVVKMNVGPEGVSDFGMAEALGSQSLREWSVSSKKAKKDEAVRYYDKALQIFDARFDSPVWKYLFGATRILDTLGEIMGERKFYDKAIDICESCSGIERHGDTLKYLQYDPAIFGQAFKIRSLDSEIPKTTAIGAIMKEIESSFIDLLAFARKVRVEKPLDFFQPLYCAYDSIFRTEHHIYGALAGLLFGQYDKARKELRAAVKDSSLAMGFLKGRTGQFLQSCSRTVPPGSLFYLCRSILNLLTLGSLPLRLQKKTRDSLASNLHGLLRTFWQSGLSPGYRLYKLKSLSQGLGDAGLSISLDVLEEGEEWLVCSGPLMPAIYDATMTIARQVPSGDFAPEVLVLGKKFAGSTFAIDARDVNYWIGQFGRYRATDLALQLARSITYLSRDAIYESARRLYSSLPRNIQHNGLLMGLGPFLKSGNHYGYYFKQAIGLKDKMLEARATMRAFQHAIRTSQIERQGLILLDDFIGSGDQACKWIRELRAEYAILNETPIFYLAAAGTSRGRRKIQTEIGIDVRLGVELSEKESIFSHESAVFSCPDDRSRVRKVLEHVGNQLKPSFPLGYPASDPPGVLLAFFYTTPNNVPPAIWQDGHVDGRAWLALLPKR